LKGDLVKWQENRVRRENRPKSAEGGFRVRESGKYRQVFWVRALIVGLLLSGQVHLFSAEIFHHHTDVARLCQIEHQGGAYLHAGQPIIPPCPICQVVRNGSVRPAVQSAIRKPDHESIFQPVTQPAQYSSNSPLTYLARGPPLS
jgi:hypothetical protein